MPEKENITEIYLSMRGRLSGLASRIVPPKEVEDIVQETYVKLCQVQKKEEIREPRSFMMRVARNLALDYLKRSETRLATSTEDIDISGLGFGEDLYDETCNNVASDEEFALFCEAVRSLPKQCRRVFVMKKVYGYSQREISQQLKISENTIEKHVALGVRRCAAYLKDKEIDLGNKNRHSLSVVDGGRQ